MHIEPVLRTRKPRGQGASRRGEILAAATRLFLAEGVAHATMRRIAAAVGVSPSALYVYFPDKDAILAAIAEATFAEMLLMLERSQDPALPIQQRFRAGLEAYVAFGLAHADAYRITFVSTPAVPTRCETVQAADHSFAILQQGVEGMMAAGLFRPGPSLMIAEGIWACLHGLTALLLDQPQHLVTPPEQLVGGVLDMMCAGLGLKVNVVN